MVLAFPGFLNTTENGTSSRIYATNGPMYVANFQSILANENDGIFAQIWTPTFIPLFLAGALFPLTLIRTPVIFTKLSSAGILSVAYLVILVAIKAGIIGVNFSFCEDPSLRG